MLTQKRQAAKKALKNELAQKPQSLPSSLVQLCTNYMNLIEKNLKNLQSQMGLKIIQPYSKIVTEKKALQNKLYKHMENFQDKEGLIWCSRYWFYAELLGFDVPLSWLEYMLAQDHFKPSDEHFRLVDKVEAALKCLEKEINEREELTDDFRLIFEDSVSRCNEITLKVFPYIRVNENDYKQLLPEEMEIYLDKKNKKHKKYEGPFNGKIIYARLPGTTHRIDPYVFDVLYQNILNIKNSLKKRTQFIVVSNMCLSHAMGLDVGVDPIDNQLVIFAFDSTHNPLFHELLKKIKDKFPKAKILASQTFLQTEQVSGIEYPYLVLCETAKYSLSQMSVQVQNAYQQPYFKSPGSIPIEIKDNDLGIHWFNFRNFFWCKAQLARFSYVDLSLCLEGMVRQFGHLTLGDSPNEITNKNQRSFLKRFQAGHGETNLYAYKRGERIFKKVYPKLIEPIGLPEITEVLTSKKEYRKLSGIKVEDPQMLLRRSAAGFGAKRYLKRLIEILIKHNGGRGLDGQSPINEEKVGQMTALHHTEKNKHIRRSLMLLEAGASPHIHNQAGKTFAQLIDENPSHEFRKNETLMRYLKKK